MRVTLTRRLSTPAILFTAAATALGAGLTSELVAQQQTARLAPLQQRAGGDGGEIDPPAQVAVSPARFEIEIGSRPVVEALRLINFSEEDLDIRVTVVPWDLDEFNRVRVLDPDEQSLDQWLILNPRNFTVPGKTSQTVRFAIRPRARPEDGEHRAMIYLEEIPRDLPEGKVKIAFKLGVAVYAYAGAVVRQGELNKVSVAADREYYAAAFDISSGGNAHVRLAGEYAVWPVDNFPGVMAMPILGDDPETTPFGILGHGSLPTTPVLGGTRRELLVARPHSLPAGRYVLGFQGELDGQPFRNATEFSVPPAANVAVAADQQQQQQDDP